MDTRKGGVIFRVRSVFASRIWVWDQSDGQIPTTPPSRNDPIHGQSRNNGSVITEKPKTSSTTEKETKAKKPSLFKVILHNDDYTPMELVTEILMRFFDKTLSEATHIMLTVHKKGSGVAGLYTLEIAETKVIQVHAYARQFEAPLLATVEEA